LSSSVSFSGVRSSSHGPTICTPTGNPSGRKSGRVDEILADDPDTAGFLVGRMIVRISGRRHDRADYRVEPLERRKPKKLCAFDAIPINIKRKPMVPWKLDTINRKADVARDDAIGEWR
jgi:hypothetical protein